VPVTGLGQSIDPTIDHGDAGRSDASGLEQVLAHASLVQNILPAGSTWDGKTDLPMTDAEFSKMMTGIDQDASDSATSGDGGAAPAAAPAAGSGAAARPAADPGHSAATASGADPTGM
jgi:hypothetical protein